MVSVARGHQRADTLKPYSQKSSQSNHTRTTALSNSVKLSHARRATQDGRVMVERPDRMWSTGEGNGKPLQYSCLENPMNSMKSMACLVLVIYTQSSTDDTSVMQGGSQEQVDLLGVACLPALSPHHFERNNPVSSFALHHLSFELRDHIIVYSSVAAASSSAGTAAVGNSAAESQSRDDSRDRESNSPLSVTERCKIRRLEIGNIVKAY